MILAIALAALNILGGRGLWPYSRQLCRFVLMPLCIGVSLGVWWQLPLFLLWGVFGWGRGFQAFHGRYSPDEMEIGWVDWISDKLYQNDGKKSTNLSRGVLWMSIRGMFLYPFFLSIGAPVAGAAMFLQGACYGVGRYVPEKYAVLLGEGLTGILIGIIVSCLTN